MSALQPQLHTLLKSDRCRFAASFTSVVVVSLRFLLLCEHQNQQKSKTKSIRGSYNCNDITIRLEKKWENKLIAHLECGDADTVL